jgi:hypothetical protein
VAEIAKLSRLVDSAGTAELAKQASGLFVANSSIPAPFCYFAKRNDLHKEGTTGEKGQLVMLAKKVSTREQLETAHICL